MECTITKNCVGPALEPNGTISYLRSTNHSVGLLSLISDDDAIPCSGLKTIDLDAGCRIVVSFKNMATQELG